MGLDNSSKQHLVFGAGLIGCYIGGVLSYRSLLTKLVCRPAVEERLKNGITLTDYQQHVSRPIALQFVHDDESLAADFLWLTVKCTAVRQAITDIAPFVNSNTIILCCQNGLGSDALVKQAFPDNQVLRVMVGFNVVERDDGQYHRGSQGELVIEQSNEFPLLVSTLISKINCPLLPASYTADMNALLWAKLQLNLGNAVNALANVPVKTMLQDRSYRLVIAKLMTELLAVTKALDINLPKVTRLPARLLPVVLSLPNFIFKRIANRMLAIDPQVRTSMWWDVSQGKTTEIDYLNGAIVVQARLLGLATPANEKIIGLVKNLESTNKQQKSPSSVNSAILLNMLQ